MISASLGRQTTEGEDMDRWWTHAGADEVELSLVNGVFKGGGARGAAYAGALEAVERAGVWFTSVAGASAGAITAALIAAGVRPGTDPSPPPKDLDQADALVLRRPRYFADVSLEALARVRLALPRAILGGRDSLFDPEPLHDWLDALLREQLGRTDTKHIVTFGELFEASGIELFVVAMDLHSRAPVVFHWATTPKASVASAVVASCAIPGALPSGRMCTANDETLYVDQLIDGGSWANFPVFVYKDRLFRSWMKKRFPEFKTHPIADENRVTLGFVLGKQQSPEFPTVVNLSTPRESRRVSEFDRGSAISSGSIAQHIVATFLGRWSGRFGVVAAFGIWLWLTTTAYPQTARRWTTAWAAFGSGGMWPIGAFVVVTAVLFTVLLVALVVVAAVVLGNAIGKLVIPAALAALGVATGTPPWIGERADQFAAIWVPCDGLQTVRFKPNPAVVKEVNRVARLSVAEQLIEACTEPASGVAPLIDAAQLAECAQTWRSVAAVDGVDDDATGTSAPRRAWLLNPRKTGSVLFVSSALGLLLFGGAFYVLERSSYADPRPTAEALGIGAGIAGVGLALATLGRRKRWLPGHAGWGLVTLAVAFAMTPWDTARKAPYVVGAFLLAVAGAALVVWMLSRASSRAYRRATERPGPQAVSTAVLLGLGTAFVVVALPLVNRVSRDLERETVAATLIAVIDEPSRGVEETYCLGATRPRCADSVTITSTKSAYRVGDHVLLRPTDSGYTVETVPSSWGWLLGAIALLFAGIGLLASGLKQTRYLKRLRYEGSFQQGRPHTKASEAAPSTVAVP